MKEVRRGTYKYYKGSFIIVFYDREDLYIEYTFDNVREILKFIGKPINRTNVNIINNELYRALKSESHLTRFLTGDMMKVYIVKTGRGKLS